MEWGVPSGAPTGVRSVMCTPTVITAPNRRKRADTAWVAKEWLLMTASMPASRPIRSAALGSLAKLLVHTPK